MSPKVTVVIAAWNAEAFIERAIFSALAQDIELEVVVADDASTDNTAALVSAIADPRLRLVTLPQNAGPGGARNAALALARGAWVAVLDADDRFSPGRLAHLVEVGETHAADIVADNVRIEDADGQQTLFLDEPLDGSLQVISFADYCLNNRLFGSKRPLGYLKPLFRRAFLNQHGLVYDARLRIGEDYDLVERSLVKGATYVRVRSTGYIYVTREGSISRRLAASDVAQMLRVEEEAALDFVGLELKAQRALQRRLKSLRAGHAYLKIVEDLKGRKPGRALDQAIRHPGAWPLLTLPLQARFTRMLAR